jgi:hypothetical protein
VESTPAGAIVRTGIQYVNNVADLTTGLVVGRTSLIVQIHAADIAVMPASGEANLVTLLQLPGYYDHVEVIGLGPRGRLEPGHTYTITAYMRPIP